MWSCAVTCTFVWPTGWLHGTVLQSCALSLVFRATTAYSPCLSALSLTSDILSFVYKSHKCYIMKYASLGWYPSSDRYKLFLFAFPAEWCRSLKLRYLFSLWEGGTRLLSNFYRANKRSLHWAAYEFTNGFFVGPGVCVWRLKEQEEIAELFPRLDIWLFLSIYVEEIQSLLQSNLSIFHQCHI